MIRGRTSRGTPLRSTAGMKTTKKKRFWLLVGDRHRLCLYETIRNERSTKMILTETLHNPEGRQKGRELLADRPGRSFDSRDSSRHGQTGGTRHSYGNAADIKTAVSEKWAKRAVALVDEHLASDEQSELTVVAGPQLIGKLRSALAKAAPKATIRFEEKDYAWLDEPELKRRVSRLAHK